MSSVLRLPTRFGLGAKDKLGRYTEICLADEDGPQVKTPGARRDESDGSSGLRSPLGEHDTAACACVRDVVACVVAACLRLWNRRKIARQHRLHGVQLDAGGLPGALRLRGDFSLNAVHGLAVGAGQQLGLPRDDKHFFATLALGNPIEGRRSWVLPRGGHHSAESRLWLQLCDLSGIPRGTTSNRYQI